MALAQEFRGALIAAPSFQLMFVTGKDTMEEAERAVEDFHVRDYGLKVKCPFLIMHGADDLQVPQGHAQSMFDANRISRQGAADL